MQPEKKNATHSVRLLFILIFCFTGLPNAITQNAKIIGRNNYEMVKLNLRNGVISDFKPLPFDVPFVFYGDVDSGINSILIYYRETTGSLLDAKNTNKVTPCLCKRDTIGSIRLCEWRRRNYTSTKTQDTFYMTVPALKPNSRYEFVMLLKRDFSFEELKSINTLQKRYVKGELRQKLGEYTGTPQQIKTKFAENFKSNLDALRDQYFKKNKVLYYTENADFYKTNKQIHSNISLTFVTDKFVKLNSDFISSAQLIKNAITQVDEVKKSIETIESESASTTKIEFPSGDWMVAEFKGVTKGANMNKAISGLYDFTTTTAFTDLNTDLTKENIEKVLTNQYIIMTRIKLEYARFDTSNHSKDNWKKVPDGFAAKMMELYTKIEACYNKTAEIKENYFELSSHLDSLNVEDYLGSINIEMPLDGSTIASFMTRAEYYISGDLGIAFAFFNSNYNNLGTQSWSEVLPYMGVNFNLAPVNRQAKYKLKNFRDICSKKGRSWWYVQKRKISVVGGVTFVSIEKTVDDVTYRKGIVGTETKFGVLTGVAYRLGDYGRITYGFIFSKYRNQNLLSEDYHLKASPFISISLDLDVKGFAENVIDGFFPNNNF